MNAINAQTELWKHDDQPHVNGLDVVRIRWHLAGREWIDTEQAELSTAAGRNATARMLFGLPADTRLRVRATYGWGDLPRVHSDLKDEPGLPRAINYLVTIEVAAC